MLLRLINHVKRSPMLVAAMFLIPLVIAILLIVRWQALNQLRAAEYEIKVKQLTAVAELSTSLILQEWDELGSTQTEIVLANLQHHSLINEAYLVNKFAGIISPRSRALEIVDDEVLGRIIDEGLVEPQVKSNLRQTVIYTPIIIDGELRGILKLVNSFKLKQQPLFNFWMYISILILAFIVIMLIIMLMRVWSRPWNELHDSIEKALDDNIDPVPLKSADQTLEKHWTLYRRLLAKLRHRSDSIQK